ncbi:MAG: hypothetical protein U1F83_04375 [Verrucomicrobiota bacterium]
MRNWGRMKNPSRPIGSLLARCRATAGAPESVFRYAWNQATGRGAKILDDAAVEPEDGCGLHLISLAELYLNYGRQFHGKAGASERQGARAFESCRQEDAPLEVGLQLETFADGLSLLRDTEGAAKLFTLTLINFGDPSSPCRDILRAKLVDIYLRGNDHANATEQLKAILVDNPGNASCCIPEINIAFDEKRWTDAIEHYQRALLFNPSFEQAHYDLWRATGWSW